MAKKFQEAAQRGESLGLNIDELSFYDALATNEAAVRELGDATLKKIAVELTQNLCKSITVDWVKRETVRTRLRAMVKALLVATSTAGQAGERRRRLKQAESLSAAQSASSWDVRNPALKSPKICRRQVD